MAIKVSNTTVIDDSRQLQNVREFVQTVSSNTSLTASYTYVITTDTTITLTLPATPAVGDFVKVVNAGTGIASSLARNGSLIMGLAENMTIDVAPGSFTATYSGATKGWVIS